MKITPIATTLTGAPVAVLVQRNRYGTVFWTVDPKHDFVLLDDGDGPAIHRVGKRGEMFPTT